MPEGTPLTAIDAMRSLMVRIDPLVTGLMDAHDLRFAGLHATAEEACVQFAGASPSPWKVAIRQLVSGDLRVCLSGSDDIPDWITLSVVVGAASTPTLPQALGLALSLIGFAGQLAT